MKKPNVGDDIKLLDINFDLYSALFAVFEEMKKKEFEYKGIDIGRNLLTYQKGEEMVHVVVRLREILIRQIEITEGDAKNKLKVLHVLDQSHRSFNLV